MGQFSLYRNTDSSSNKIYPYFIDVQNPLLEDLNSRLVIPLSHHTTLNNTDAKKLCPVIRLDDSDYVVLTHQMTSVPKSLLQKEVTTLKDYRYAILAAIDMLISGI